MKLKIKTWSAELEKQFRYKKFTLHYADGGNPVIIGDKLFWQGWEIDPADVARVFFQKYPDGFSPNQGEELLLDVPAEHQKLARCLKHRFINKTQFLALLEKSNKLSERELIDVACGGIENPIALEKWIVFNGEKYRVYFDTAGGIALGEYNDKSKAQFLAIVAQILIENGRYTHGEEHMRNLSRAITLETGKVETFSNRRRANK